MNLYEYVESIRHKKICVIGAGISNLPFIRLLLLSGCSVTVCDQKDESQINQNDLDLIQRGAHYKLGANYLSDLDFDIIFRTPGLMPFEPHLEEARRRGCRVTSEMEVFFELCPCRTIAITGSDGKTTTSTIIAELLKKEGYHVHLGGNIGKPLLCDLPFIRKEDFAVLELSSFQLHSMFCRPDVAVITNISPNHLDKHKDFEDYVQAKKNIFLNQESEGILVLNEDDALCIRFGQETSSKVRSFSLKSEVRNGYYLQSGTIMRGSENGPEAVISAERIRIPGTHNIANYMAAFCATDDYVGQQTREYVAEHFGGVEHRLELVRSLHGVDYINDSIGTSPTRTIAGLNALNRKPILILGGYDKHLAFDELGEKVCQRAKAVFLTGDTAEKIHAAILRAKSFRQDQLPVEVDPDFESCVKKAFASAREGDIVLLSPACAAFDRFRNFEERGRFFKKMVMELKE